MYRNSLLHSFAAGLGLLLAVAAEVSAATTFHINSRAEFIAARQQVQPGDTIVFPEGVLEDWGQLFVGENGTAEAPITIRAPYIFGTTLTGNSFFQIQASHIVIQGFRFDHADGNHPVWLTIGSHNRVRQCYFREAQASSALRSSATDSPDPTMGSFHRIDHNFFTITRRAAVTILGPDDENHPGGSIVEFNVFRDSPARGNAAEALIPYSLGKHQGAQTNLIIRYNVFDRWDADNESEIVSFKSGGNHFYRNVLAWNRGYFSLRRENNNIVEENLFYHNRDGLWIYGDGHIIINNLIEGISRDGILLPSGWFRSRDQIEARAATNNLIAHNTFRNVEQRSLAFRVLINENVEHPSNNILVNNIFDSEVAIGALIQDNVAFMNRNTVDSNIFFSNTGVYGPRGNNPITASARLAGSAWQTVIQADSPAIGAGFAVEGVERDFFGRTRGPSIDIGHHAFTSGTRALKDPLMPPVPTSRVGYREMPLEATFTTFPSFRAVGEPINLDASASKGEIVSYRWDLGDGHVYEGPEHFYPYDWATPGPKVVRLTVTDATGATHSTTRVVRITGDGEVPGSGWLDTGDWLGPINTKADPFWWVQGLQHWVFAPAESDGWLYLFPTNTPQQ